MRWLDRARPRNPGGGRRGPGQLSHLDAGGAGVGAGPARQGPLRSRAGRTGCRDAARHLGVQGETGGPPDAGHRQPLVPAVLEAAVLEVLPGIQPLRHEVFPARGAVVLGLRRQAVHHRQHQPGAAPRQRQAGGDRAGNGLLRRALRLHVPLPCDRPREPKSRRREKFLDGRDQLPAGPQLPEPGGSEPAGTPVGHGAHGEPPGQQDAIDPRPGFRARTPLSDRTAGPAPRAVLAA